MVKPKAVEITISKGDGASGATVSQGGGQNVKGIDLGPASAKAGAMVAAGIDLNADSNGAVSLQPKAGLGVGELIMGPAVTIKEWGKIWDGSE